jgi:hypothetical protein
MRRLLRWVLIGVVSIVVVAVVSFIAALIFLPQARMFAVPVASWLLFAKKPPPAFAERLIPSAGPLDSPAISRKLTAALEEKFPLGAKADDLKRFLISQGFRSLKPPPANCVPAGQSAPVGVAYVNCYDINNRLEYHWNAGMVCGETIVVHWSANGREELTHLAGGYQAACL